MAKLVCGVGVNDGKYPAKVKGKNLKEYALWQNMLHRCYSPKVHLTHPTYVGCSLSENFKSYSFFHDWCCNQVGFNSSDSHLDKDLLLKGNQLYSEDTCIFVPSELNALLLNRVRFRGVLPLGVNKLQGRYRAQLSLLGKIHGLGYFDTPEEAFQAYKTAKEAHVKHMAELYKDRVDIRVYEALLAYQVEITD